MKLKSCGIVLAVFVVLGAILFAVVMQLTSGLTQSAEIFFNSIKNGDVQTAYESTSKGFQMDTSPEEFEQFVDAAYLKSYKSSFWQSRSISGQRGTLNGTITYEDGAVLPVDMSLVKEQDSWKIFWLHIGAWKR